MALVDGWGFGGYCGLWEVELTFWGLGGASLARHGVHDVYRSHYLWMSAFPQCVVAGRIRLKSLFQGSVGGLLDRLSPSDGAMPAMFQGSVGGLLDRLGR